MFKKYIFIFFALIFSSVSVYSMTLDDIGGSFSERSLIMRSLNGLDKMNQEDRDSLASKKLTPTPACMLEQIKKNNMENLKTLLDAKVNPNNGHLAVYPIYYAAKLNRTDMVYVLYEYGAKLDRGFYSELYESVRNKNAELARFLLDRGAKINYTDSVTNNTILSMALRNNMLEIARELIEKGAYADSMSVKIIRKRKLQDLIPDDKK